MKSLSDPVDEVNHPKHYTSHPSGVECIQITEHMSFNLGNAVKYIWRAGLKSEDAEKDLSKAIFYLERECGRLAVSARASGTARVASQEHYDKKFDDI